MSVNAKTLVKDKFWIIEQNGQKLGTLQKKDNNGYVYLNKAEQETQVYENIGELTKKFGVDVNYLPHHYSLMDIHRKNLVYTDPTWNWWKDDLTNLYNSGWVYQFNDIPQNRMARDQAYWMERIYKELYK